MQPASSTPRFTTTANSPTTSTSATGNVITPTTGNAPRVRSLSRDDTSARDKDALACWHPLMMAAADGDETAVDALLHSGATNNRIGPAGQAALIVAARNGRTATLQTLLAAGADVNQPAPEGGTTALMLVAAVANINQADKDEATPMMYAIRSNQVDALQVLLSANANVDQPDAKACTALMIAGGLGRTPLLKALLAAGAKVDQVDHEGRTALMMAA